MLGKYLAAGVVFAVLSSTASAATVHVYNFFGSTTGYTLTKGPIDSNISGGPTVTVQSFTSSDDGSTVSAVAGSGVGVGQWTGNGLGNLNNPGDSSHTVDSSGINDLLQLTFSSDVKILSATFAYAGVLTNSLAAFAFFADDADADSSLAGDLVFDHQTFTTVSNTGTFSFGTGSILSSVFGFGALWEQTVRTTCKTYHWVGGKKECKVWNTKTLFDSFKLKSVTVELPDRDPGPDPIPLPGALPLLATALLASGWFARRKSQA
jgi:hypothetical protein